VLENVSISDRIASDKPPIRKPQPGAGSGTFSGYHYTPFCSERAEMMLRPGPLRMMKIGPSVK
jgi:hypothetical protein